MGTVMESCGKKRFDMVRRPDLCPVSLFASALCGSGLDGVKGWIGKIDISEVHFLLTQPQAFAKPLEMDDFPLPQEPYRIVHIRIVG